MAERPDPTPPDDLLTDPLLRAAPVVEGFKVLEPAVLYARIGKGGMGAVYRGRHYKLDLDVAVKCLKPSLVDEDADFVRRFEREARLAASIAHQNVVRVMDVQEKNGLHYLVMEFVRGETFWWGDAEAQGAGKINAADKGSGSRPITWTAFFPFDDGFAFYAPVSRQVAANAFGLQDMLGNVWEWCRDSAEFTDGKVVTDTYRDGVTDPVCSRGSLRVYRGGSWDNVPASCRSAVRVASGPANANIDVGFRPALLARSSGK